MQIEVYRMEAAEDALTITLESVCDTFSSLLWDIEYYKCGSFEVYIAANPQNIEIFKTGRIVGRDDDNQHFGIIESVLINTDIENGDYLTVRGRFLMCLLERRIIHPTYNVTAAKAYSEIVREVVTQNALLTDNRRIPGLSLGTVTGACWELTATLQISYANLMDWVYTICEKIGGTANIRLIKDAGEQYRMVFDISEGCDRSVMQEDNPHIIFSDAYSNLLSFSYAEDASVERNFAYIFGQGKGDERKRTTYCVGDEPTYLDRYEVYVDADDISETEQVEGETIPIPEEKYLELLRTRGSERLVLPKTASESDIAAHNTQYVYNRDYFVGDYVTVQHRRFGMMQPQIQLIGMIEGFDQNGRSLTPTFKEWSIMAFYSGFFNSKGLDRTYTAEDFTSYLSSIICNGILDTYGQNFKLTAANSGLGVVLGTGKAWIDGHYFINDSRYVIDLTSYQDESLPRYVGIAIYLDTTESVRSVSLRLFPGTPAENPSLPSIPQDEDHVRLLMYAVRMNPGASRITESDWFDYREDSNVCGYCKCILGKCKVTELMSQMAQLIVEVQENNETIAELTNKVEELEAEVEDIGDIVSAGQCGENVFYAMYSNGKVLLKGSGDTYDYDSSNRSPFYRNDDIKRVVISEGVTSVGDDLFIRCLNLESASLPTTVTSIGSTAFMPADEMIGAAGKLTNITIPQAVTSIGGGCFWGSALTSVTIPPNVATVGNYAFRDCSRLTTVRYEGSVIGGYMFGSCTALNSFTIANTVTRIGEHCFNYCQNLETITYEGSLEQWQAITKGTNWDGKGGSGIAVSGLTRINCLDGFMEWDDENHEWKVGEE